MGPGGEGWGPAFLFVSLYKHTHPDPVSRNRGRHLRTPPTQPGGSAAGAAPAAHAAAAPASVRGNLCGLRTRTRRGGDDGRARWRLDGGARRVETMAPSSPPPVLLGRRLPHRLAMRPRFLLLPSPSGRRWRRRRHRTCVQRRARWRASPVGNAKTHSTPSHDDGVEHKWWLPSPPRPPLLPPWASSRRPRHHIRRRLRRATRCVGAFAAAPAQHARALRAIDPCCAGTSWPD